jgi:Lamin Tail Domain/Secretion system C-terminal sorting domain
VRKIIKIKQKIMKKILLTSIAITTVIASFGQQLCSELFISEYVEGSGNDKGIEIYNPTDAEINLEGYSVVRYSNGSATASVPADLLTGVIASHDVFVLINGQVINETNSPACSPALQALADQLAELYPGAMYMNGNDAVALLKDGVLIDLIGKIGEDPGQSWSDVFPYNDAVGTWWTKDHTLIRKASIQYGVSVNPTVFNVTSEWDSLPENTWNNLGTHTCECGTIGIRKNNDAVKLSVYPNPTASGEINITSDLRITNIVFINSIGQTFAPVILNNNSSNLTISTSNFATGIYQLVVNFDNSKRKSMLISIE